MSRLSLLATFGLLAAQGTASILGRRRFDSSVPFYDYDPNVPADCNLWWNSDDGISCETVLLITGLSIGQLTSMNPSVKSCSDWKADRSFCIGSASGIPTPTVGPTTTSRASAGPTTTSTPTNPGSGVQTPEPWQPGMVDNCNRFYQVQDGDTCANIASKTGVTVAQLATWNTQIGGSACTGIWAGYYLCTGVIGGSPTQPSPTTTPNPTPQPIQDGMVDNCNRFHLVQAGDTCATIASSAGVTVAQLTTWNTGIGSSCTGMWAGYYLCTGVTGGSPTQPSPTTTPNPTPQPVQDGMVSNCKKFHFVQLRQTCDTISQQYGITLADFTRWNPAVGSSCQGLWAQTYACVGL
ncbi:lysM domain-containing protein ARB_05157 [Colletotrichum liriopes]|uniref:LysM domain-containing protein ARB_05157 n=1 Tax=Colletotrichum liriopes TaxID=708192 RepID=A0AA37LZJ0_9PEZI|nr:lysM domain-containing protein ARB_05157 [Colletotrichum liriopes]